MGSVDLEALADRFVEIFRSAGFGGFGSALASGLVVVRPFGLETFHSSVEGAFHSFVEAFDSESFQSFVGAHYSFDSEAFLSFGSAGFGSVLPFVAFGWKLESFG